MFRGFTKYVGLKPLKVLIWFCIGITGQIVMDFKADRIMDYIVYSLPPEKNRYEQVLDIPMTALQKNGTKCSSWIVCSAECLSFSDLYNICFSNNFFKTFIHVHIQAELYCHTNNLSKVNVTPDSIGAAI